jgi:hypothetical protein
MTLYAYAPQFKTTLDKLLVDFGREQFAGTHPGAESIARRVLNAVESVTTYADETERLLARELDNVAYFRCCAENYDAQAAEGLYKLSIPADPAARTPEQAAELAVLAARVSETGARMSVPRGELIEAPVTALGLAQRCTTALSEYGRAQLRGAGDADATARTLLVIAVEATDYLPDLEARMQAALVEKEEAMRAKDEASRRASAVSARLDRHNGGRRYR